jgi:uncharacterized damage-inducible protein DinB
VNKQEIQLLYRYNAWANARILDAAGGLTGEQFIAPSSFPHGGVRGTLVHAMSAESVLHMRWEGSSPAERYREDDFPTLASLLLRWKDDETLLMAFIEDLSDERLNAPLEYKNNQGVPVKEGPLWTVMLHVVNHGTQHRSEAAALLTDFGCSPGNLDLIIYLREQK